MADGYRHPGTLTHPRDVVGIVSTDPGIKMSGALTGVPVALAGRVPVKVTLEGGPIRVGDLLTTSSTPAHAMKAAEPWKGGIIGTALEAFDGKDDGQGTMENGTPSGDLGHGTSDLGPRSGKIIALVHLNPAPACPE